MYVSNVELNLNEYTVRYATSQPGIGVYLGPWGYANDITIHNGQIHGGNQEESHIINVPDGARHNIHIYNLNTSSQGLQTAGIVLKNSLVNVSIHNVNISLAGIKADPCSHYGGHIAGIGLTNPGGKIDIHDNRITGTGMLGIAYSDCINPFTEPARIYNNYISMWSPVRDGYAISVSGRNGACSDGGLWYNNTIDQINGRGFAVAGWDSEADHGPGNIEIFNNNITVREGWDCEYDASGTPVGVRVRFGAHDVYVHDNYIYGYSGTGIANGSHPTKDGSTATGLYVGAPKPYGKNNRFENNYIEVITNDINFYTKGIYLSDSNSASSASNTWGMTFINNTIKTNNVGISNDGGDGTSYNILFVNTTIIKADNPLGFAPVMFGGWFTGAENITFIDTSGVNTSIHEIAFNTDYSRVYSDLFFKWTLTVLVKDDNENMLEGATISIEDNAPRTIAQGTSNSKGSYSSILTERTYNTTSVTGSYPDYYESTPHTVTVTYNNQTLTREVTINTMKTETFTFTLGPCDEGTTRQCGTSDVGACQYGTQTCASGAWEVCSGNIDPVTEICENTFDDDCDGLTDYEDTLDCSVPVCSLPKDIYPCDCINQGELLATISAWYAGELDIAQLIVNIKNWKISSC